MKSKLHWLFSRLMNEEDGSGAGGSAPAPEPETNDGDGVDWEAMNDNVGPGDDDGGGQDTSVVDDPDAPPGAGGHEASDDDPPVDEPTTGKEKSVEDPAAPVQDPEPQETPEQKAAAQKKLEEDFTKWRQGRMEELTKAYAFDEDTASRLQTEPELVLPELAARMHMDVLQQVVETVQRMMPQMVQPVLKNTSREREATELFYGTNNDLNPAKHQKHVLAAAKTFRELNPDATPQEAVKGIGEIVRVSLGLKTRPTEKQAAPAASARKAAPHRPPAAGARGAKPGGKEERTEWDDLLDD